MVSDDSFMFCSDQTNYLCCLCCCPFLVPASSLSQIGNISFTNNISLYPGLNNKNTPRDRQEIVSIKRKINKNQMILHSV